MGTISKKFLKNGFTRDFTRSFIFVCAVVYAVIALFCGNVAATVPDSNSEAVKIRVLVLDGGHPYDETAFAEMLTTLGDEFEFVRARLPEARSLLKPGLEKDFDVVLFYDMCQVSASDDEYADFTALATGGKVGLFFLHHRICAHPERSDFWKFAGGTYVFEQNREICGEKRSISSYEHGRTIDVEPAKSVENRPFQLESFSIVDEVYSDVWVAPDADVLLKTNAERATPAVAWTWRLGNRDALVLLLGHDGEAYRNPGFRNFLKNGLNWLAKNSSDYDKK